MEDQRRDQGPLLTGGLRTSADTSQGGGDNSAAKQTPPLPASYKDWGGTDSPCLVVYGPRLIPGRGGTEAYI